VGICSFLFLANIFSEIIQYFVEGGKIIVVKARQQENFITFGSKCSFSVKSKKNLVRSLDERFGGEFETWSSSLYLFLILLQGGGLPQT